MKRVPIICAVLLCCVTAATSDPPKRPRIFGIASVRILASSPSDSESFYAKLLSKDYPCLWCGQRQIETFSVNETQFVELAKSPTPAPSNLIDEITFATDDVTALRRYFVSCHIPTKALVTYHPADLPKEPDIRLSMLDPEGHRIGFVQLPPEVLEAYTKHHEKILIHAGFIVKDRAAEDAFYKKILGFHLYWQGGMKDDEVSWVGMQVPDGTDWLEYMLNISPNADKHTVGVMNHIAIGVSDIEAANFAARKSGVAVHEDPKIGRDGKWQLNLYDPDDTRVEFMEFTPKEKPCCSEFTGPHPGPKP